MAGALTWMLPVAVLAIVALIGWAVTFGVRRRQNQECLDIIPVQFQPARRFVGAGGVPELERDGGAVRRAEIDINHAHLVAKLQNSGSGPLSIDQIVVFDQHRLHKYAVLQKADLRLDHGDSKTVDVKIPPFEGVRYVTPPEGGGMIEVITATQTFLSEPFRFSDLVWGGSGSAGAERAA